MQQRYKIQYEQGSKRSFTSVRKGKKQFKTGAGLFPIRAGHENYFSSALVFPEKRKI